MKRSEIPRNLLISVQTCQDLFNTFSGIFPSLRTCRDKLRNDIFLQGKYIDLEAFKSPKDRDKCRTGMIDVFLDTFHRRRWENTVE
ncbi:hypothetical protein CEXT_725761 [Caerostris extrusa]|uniref:Uncharacterized protein n=1 Tax=Caerostris extrusa TaxID=172846 RepID=A0AAV4XWT9_CAEEX|nr:hypothetical protein CEXT_725761 [Caerostris extrusa]